MSEPSPSPLRVRRRRLLVTGVAAVGVYVVAAALTIGLGDHHVRPLFEGFSPPPPYQWVNPPKQFAASNQVPKPNTSSVALGADGSAVGGASTNDGQCLLSLGPGAIAPSAGDDKVAITLTPLDPATLGPLPGGLSADGNAYRVDMERSPSKTPVTALAKPGNVVLVVPADSHALLFSVDGKAWTQLPTQNLGSATSVGGPFDRPGFYVGGTSVPTGGGGAAKGSGGGSTGALVVGVAAVVLVGGLLAVSEILRRRRAAARAQAEREREERARRERAGQARRPGVNPRRKRRRR